MANEKTTTALAITTLILNVFILPGLGSLIAGRSKEGTWQLVLFVIGIPLIFLIVGIPLMLAMWIWGIVTAVQVVKQAP